MRTICFGYVSRQRVGGDAHIAPLGTIGFAGDFHKNGACCRVDVGIDPYELLRKVLHVTAYLSIEQQRLVNAEPAVLFEQSQLAALCDLKELVAVHAREVVDLV